MYETLGRYYDIFTADVKYDEWCDFAVGFFDGTRGADVGCGSGGFTSRLALRGYSVIGVDGSPEMIAAANKNAAKLGLKTVYAVQDCEKLPSVFDHTYSTPSFSSEKTLFARIFSILYLELTSKTKTPPFLRHFLTLTKNFPGDLR